VTGRACCLAALLCARLAQGQGVAVVAGGGVGDGGGRAGGGGRGGGGGAPRWAGSRIWWSIPGGTPTWEKKRQALHENSRLFLNRDLETLPAWDEEGIEARGSRLFDLACGIWPRPGA
jgi:hypothetical protein